MRSVWLGLGSALVAALIVGCGLSTSDEDSGTPSASGNISISGVISDGPVFNAQVTLQNIFGSGFVVTAVTDHQGRYTLEIPKDKISSLQNADMILVHAVSTSETRLNCNDSTCSNGGQPVAAGQIELRSILDAEGLKVAAQSSNSLDGKNPGTLASGIAAKLNATPISNAQIAVMEAQLGFDTPIRPNSIETLVLASKTSSMQERLTQLDIELSQNPTGNLANKIMNVAVATKAIGEMGKTDLVSSASDLTLNDSAEIIRRVAKSTEALKILVSEMNSLVNGLKQDLLVLGDVFLGVKDVINQNNSGTVSAGAGVDATKITYNFATHLPTISSQTELKFTLPSGIQTVQVTSENGIVSLKSGSTEFVRYSSSQLLSVLGQSLNFNLRSFEATTGTAVSFFQSQNLFGSNSNGVFYELSFGTDPVRKILFASRRLADSSLQALGIVGLYNILDQQNVMYRVSSMVLNGQSLPAGSFQEAVTLARKITPEAIQSALNIANDLKLSGDLQARQQGRLTFAVASLAKFAMQTSSSTGSSLSSLMTKLGIEETGRSLRDFTAKLIRTSDEGLTVKDIQGIRDIQNFLGGSDPQAVLGAISLAIDDLKAILNEKPSTASFTDSFAEIFITGRLLPIVVEYKDVLYLLAGLEGARFLLYYISMHNFDLSDEDISFYSNSQVNSTVTALNTYSKKNAVVPNPALKDVLQRNSSFLAARSGYSGKTAADYLQAAADYAAQYLDKTPINGGNENSVFYLRSIVLENRNYYLMMALSLYNNLNGSLRTDISVRGLSGGAWYDSSETYPGSLPDSHLYKAAVSNIDALPSEKEQFLLNFSRKTVRRWISTAQPPYMELSTRRIFDWVRIRLRSFLETPLRDLALVTELNNNQNLGQHIWEKHLRGSSISSVFTQIFPGSVLTPDAPDKEFFGPQRLNKVWEDKTADVTVRVSLENLQVTTLPWDFSHSQRTPATSYLFGDQAVDKQKLRYLLESKAAGVEHYYHLIPPVVGGSTQSQFQTSLRLFYAPYPSGVAYVLWIQNTDTKKLMQCYTFPNSEGLLNFTATGSGIGACYPESRMWGLSSFLDFKNPKNPVQTTAVP
ncbi:MAG: carboxypeptidase regulatory-like domain-containing protein [Candidatus Cloacimonetes bacterium]|nr:carboxypeptidase regulatory-like domain-containing protein [Candidatus Cloacimonadota bacterium]